MTTRVVLLRGHQPNPWELRPFELLDERFDVRYLRTGSSWFDTDGIDVTAEHVRSVRDLLPRGRLGDALVRVPGDRYVGLERHLADAQIVHSQELGYWYSAQAARLKRKLGYRLVLTVWETIPFHDAYRNVRTRPYRRAVLEATDLFLAATERAAAALELEGADPARIRISPPGIDTERFAPTERVATDPPLVLMPGRLVWEKGHQDLLRALALLKRRRPSVDPPRVVIVGRGPEDRRLLNYAAELGVEDHLEVRPFVPYESMPELYGQASCVALLSLALWSWEEQFGMVLAEALAAGVPIVASTSGAIPEVAGPHAQYVAPGDWVGLADVLAGITAAPHRVYDRERVERFAATSAAARLASAYDALIGQ